MTQIWGEAEAAMSAASEKTGNDLEVFKDCYLKVEAQIWPSLFLYVPYSLDGGVGIGVWGARL